jgi:hypothetical protein
MRPTVVFVLAASTTLCIASQAVAWTSACYPRVEELDPRVSRADYADPVVYVHAGPTRCTGTLVQTANGRQGNKVITAAHCFCFDTHTPVDPSAVFVEFWHFPDLDNRYGSAYYTIHDDYHCVYDRDDRDKGHDIAVITLDRDVTEILPVEPAHIFLGPVGPAIDAGYLNGDEASCARSGLLRRHQRRAAVELGAGPRVGLRPHSRYVTAGATGGVDSWLRDLEHDGRAGDAREPSGGLNPGRGWGELRPDPSCAPGQRAGRQPALDLVASARAW